MNTLIPVSQERKKTRASYDRLSGWYDWLAGSEEAYNLRGLEMLGLAPGDRALEIGTGTGKCLAEIAAQGGTAVGLDISFGMARVAQSRLQKKGLRSRVLLSLGDAAQLPFSTGCFDVVFLAFTLELFEPAEIPVVLSEIRRIMRVPGRLGIVSLSLPEQPNVMVRIYQWFHQALPDLVDCRPIPVVALVTQNGFNVNQVECKNMWGLPVEMVVASRGR